MEKQTIKIELSENMHNLKIWQKEIGITPDFGIAKYNHTFSDFTSNFLRFW